MKLLVDNQLPVALARYLAENGFDCLHVQDVGMDASDDRDIWEFAESEQMVIVTKDEDFSLMADRRVGSSPQVVWARTGNCRKAALLATFSALLPDLRSLLEEGNGVIEIR